MFAEGSPVLFRETPHDCFDGPDRVEPFWMVSFVMGWVVFFLGRLSDRRAAAWAVPAFPLQIYLAVRAAASPGAIPRPPMTDVRFASALAV